MIMYNSEPPKHSRNDVQNFRNIDIIISDLVEELSKLDSSPWRSGLLITDPHVPASEQDMRPPTGTNLSELSLMAWALSGMRSQCVTFASRRNTASPGEVKHISIGHVQFRVEEAEEQRVFDNLDRGIANMLRGRMVSTCEQIEKLIGSNQTCMASVQMNVVWCGPRFVLIKGQRDADSLADSLNRGFREATAPVRARVVSQLQRAVHSLKHALEPDQA